MVLDDLMIFYIINNVEIHIEGKNLQTLYNTPIIGYDSQYALNFNS